MQKITRREVGKLILLAGAAAWVDGKRQSNRTC
jgi:hypothetical protein